MPRQDDPAISGQIFLLRRIPPYADRVEWNEAGQPIHISSANFDDPELSVCIEQETTADEILQVHLDFDWFVSPLNK